jgi:sugar lactone lactonase YvrE/predicted Ser/Thr protein kinase
MATQTFGKYEILEKVGEGGFGEVYKARDMGLGRLVALKVIHMRHLGDPDVLQRFYREARVAAALDHPHIVPVYEVGEVQGVPFIAMKYVPGRSLAQVVQERGRLPLEEAVRIAEQVASALDYAHGQGVVHRDVKPSNILVDEEGQAFVTDFGLARGLARSASYTSAGTLVGTAEYMAPEQLDVDQAAQVGPGTDQYALAVTVYQMLAGRVPFEGSTAAVLAAHLTKAPPRLREHVPEIPEGVEVAVLRALAKRPGERFESAGAFVRALAEQVERVQRERQLEAWYAEAKAEEGRGNWQRVILLCGQILEQDPEYRDVRAVLERAGERLNAEMAERKRRARLAALRQGAEEARGKGDWEALLRAAQEILELAPGDGGALAWQREAREELARREAEARRQARLADLRQQGEKALAAEEWPTLQAVASEVLSLEPEDSLARLWQRMAQEALARQALERERQARVEAAKEQAREALRARDWSQLLAYSESVLLLAPEDAEAKRWKALAAEEERKERERLERKSEKELQQRLRDLRGKIATAQRREDWDEVIGLSQALLALVPGDQEAQGWVEEARRRKEQAEAEAERAAAVERLRREAEAARRAQDWVALQARCADLRGLGLDTPWLRDWERLAGQRLQEAEQRAARLKALREQAAAAHAQEAWRDLWAAAGEILNLAPGDAEALAWRKRAEEGAREAGLELEKKRQGVPWSVLAGVVGILGVVGVAAFLVSRGGAPGAEPTPVPDRYFFAIGVQTSATQFNNPSGVAVGPDGTVYVADTNNHRILHFSARGDFLGMWGSGQFMYPRGVAVGPDGTVYVADTGNNRIQRFSARGAFLQTWGSWGSGVGMFKDPRGVAVGPDGTVYVADTGNHRIQCFSARGAFLRKWGTEGSGDGQFMYPRGVAVGPDGEVYVADTGNHRIQRFRADGTFLWKFGTEGSGTGQFNSPSGVAVGLDGMVCVADTGNHRIQCFSARGAFLGKWGSKGSGDGQFWSPTGVAVGPDGIVYVADSWNNRIQVFSASSP